MDHHMGPGPTLGPPSGGIGGSHFFPSSHAGSNTYTPNSGPNTGEGDANSALAELDQGLRVST